MNLFNRREVLNGGALMSGLLIGFGSVLAAAGVGYLAYRMTGKPFSVDPRRSAARHNVGRARPRGVPAAAIAPDKPLSTNGNTDIPGDLWWRR